MKIKKACELTFLTERAIRLYLSRNFLSPRQSGGTLNFSEEDIAILRDIALLRQLDFSLEQIGAIIRQPETIAEILRIHLDGAKEGAKHSAEVRDALLAIGDHPVHDLADLARLLRTHRPALPKPDFGRFDEISEEDRRLETVSAAQGLSRQKQDGKRKRRLICTGAAVILLLTALLIFLGHTRLEGNISTGPFTLQQFHPDGRATIVLTRPETISRLGTDTLTIPCRNYLPALKEGDLFEQSAQLAVSLSNADLIRLGVSPFQSFRSPSTNVRTAWLEWILQALFRGDPGDNAVLWLGEISGLRPLFP